jgi:cytochrome P450
VIYDPYARDMQHDPYPAYHHFLENEPCAYNEKMDFYALFRFEDVWRATLDWETYSSSLGPILENRGQMPADGFSVIGMDPPRHVKIRNLASRGFTPRKIAALEGEIRRIACSYLDPLRDADGCEFQSAISGRFPMDVISLLIGIPESERDGYREGMDKALSRDPETGEMHPDVVQGMVDSRNFLVELLEARRKDPKDDLLTILAHSEYEDVDGVKKKLTTDEAVQFSGLLAAAGFETTAKLIGNCMVYLARHPDQRQMLWDDPNAMARGIEEVLRYDAPSQYQGRVALREATEHGVTIPKGARVALVTGAACRDPREFPDPGRLDVTRQPERSIYFGHGHHVCIGKSLARLETRILLDEIRQRFPDYSVDESGLTRTYQAHVRGFATVPVVFSP